MNSINETIVSGDLFKKLRDAGIASGYEPVPEFLGQRAKVMLQGRHIASMDKDFKRKLRNRNKRMRREGVPGF